MASLLRAELLAQAPDLGRQFRSARPFPHVVIDGFLDGAFLRGLQEEFPEFDTSRTRNELGRAGGKAVHERIASLGPAYARFDAWIQTREFLEWLSELTGIPRLLYDADYVGGGTHQNMNGQELDTHVDFNYHPKTKLHRRLNLILFVNPEWEAGWGGNLNGAGRRAACRDAPAANRCVIFETSEVSWHGFGAVAMPEDQAHLGRRSIAVYFYTKDRPAEETAPSHSTFYIPRPLPERFTPGYTLDERDAWELQVLVERRDQQIRFLYERELEFGRMMQSPTFRLARALAWPARVVKRLVGK
ncbi:MAG: 2OG-Fe(II) oxygenase [Bryobacteraceae bacterium]